MEADSSSGEVSSVGTALDDNSATSFASGVSGTATFVPVSDSISTSSLWEAATTLRSKLGSVTLIEPEPESAHLVWYMTVASKPVEPLVVDVMVFYAPALRASELTAQMATSSSWFVVVFVSRHRFCVRNV